VSSKISALTAASALTGVELLAGVQGGANVKITPAQIRDYVLADPALVETAQDAAAAMLAAGANVAVSYNDAANSFTISSTDTTLTQEQVEDMVAALVVQGSNVTVTYNDAAGTLTVASTAGGGSGVAHHPGYVSGRWYPAAVGAAAAASNVLAANTITYFPFIPETNVTISDVGVRVTIAGANMLIGIFASDATTKRATGNPLGYTANIDISTTGDKTAALNTNVALTAGTLYWFGFATDTTAASCTCLGSLFNVVPYLMGSTTAADVMTSGTTVNYFLTEAMTFASGIATFSATPASETITTGSRTPLPKFKVV
jgi:hypothetical protein